MRKSFRRHTLQERAFWLRAIETALSTLSIASWADSDLAAAKSLSEASILTASQDTFTYNKI